MGSVVTVAGELLCHDTVQRAQLRKLAHLSLLLVLGISFQDSWSCLCLCHLVTETQEVPSSALEVWHREHNTEECVSIDIAPRSVSISYHTTQLSPDLFLLLISLFSILFSTASMPALHRTMQCLMDISGLSKLYHWRMDSELLCLILLCWQFLRSFLLPINFGENAQ